MPRTAYTDLSLYCCRRRTRPVRAVLYCDADIESRRRSCRGQLSLPPELPGALSASRIIVARTRAVRGYLQPVRPSGHLLISLSRELVTTSAPDSFLSDWLLESAGDRRLGTNHVLHIPGHALCSSRSALGFQKR